MADALDPLRLQLVERTIELGLVKPLSTGAVGETTSLRDKFQQLLRMSVREEMQLVDQKEEFCPLSDYLKRQLFSKKRGGYQDPSSKQERRVMDTTTLNQELFDTLGNRLSMAEIESVTRELAEIDGKKGHVSMETLKDYLRFHPSGDSAKRHRNQMPMIIEAVRKRMSALYANGGLKFNDLKNASGTQVSEGKMHKWILTQTDKSIAYDLTRSELLELLRAMASAAQPAADGAARSVPDSAAFEAFVQGDDADMDADGASTVMSAPVIDVQVSVMNSESSELLRQGYRQVLTRDPKTGENRPCNLNEGSLTAHKVYLWYLRKHGTRLMPIVDIIVESCLTKSSLAISGYTCLRKNLNRGTIGQPQYLWVRRAVDTDQARSEALVEIQATTGKERVQDDEIHLPPDRSKAHGMSDPRRRHMRDHGSAYYRVDGNLNRGSMGTDIYLWFRPRVPRSTEVDLPAHKYIKWSRDKRHAECELALKRCVRQQCTNLPDGGPDLPSLFNKHDISGRGMLTKPQFTKLLDEVGFNLEGRERDLLFNRLDVHGTDSVLQEEFLSFVSLTEHELDEIKDILKQRIRMVNRVTGQEAKDKVANLETVKTELATLNKLGVKPSPNITPQELGYMLTFIQVYPTPSELTRIVHFFDSEGKGEVIQKDFYSFIAEDKPHDMTHRRCATRVLRASEALRNFIIGAVRTRSAQRQYSAHGSSRPRNSIPNALTTTASSATNATGGAAADINSSAAWDMLLRRALKRRGSTGLLSTAMSGGSKTDDALDAVDIAVAVERQLIFDDVPRLSQREYRQLLMLVAPNGKGKVPHDDFHEFAKGTVRPLADILRIVENHIFKDLLTLFKEYHDKGGRNAESAFREELESTMRRMNFYEKDRWSPQTIKITTLQKEMRKASAKVKGGSDEESKYHPEVKNVTLSEWVSLVLHTGADVIGDTLENPGSRIENDGEDEFLVHTRKLLEGICLIVIGDVRKKEEERTVKNSVVKADPKLYSICRELQRLIQDDVAIAPNKQDDWKPVLEDDPRLDYGQWLAGALHDFGLKTDVPCALDNFKKLLLQYKKFFGWDLSDKDVDSWVKKMAGTSKTIGEPEIKAFVEGRGGWLCEAPSDPLTQEALMKLHQADDWYADIRTGDPDADKLVLRVHSAQRARGLAFSEALVALRRAFEKHDTSLTGVVTNLDCQSALNACGCGDALEYLDSATRRNALRFFQRGVGRSGENMVNYELFLQTLRRAWLTRPPPGSNGSITGSRKLDVQLAFVKRELNKCAQRVNKDKSALAPLAVFRELDTNGDGRIEPKEFDEGLKKLGINVDLSIADVKRLIAFFDDTGDGTMDAYEFLEFVLKGTVGYKAGASMHRYAESKSESKSANEKKGSFDDDEFLLEDDEIEYDDAFTAARAAIRRKWSRPEDLERLREYLTRKDFASDGTIKERVFLRFLRSSRIAADLSDMQIQKLISALDRKGDHWIDYKLFTRRVIDRAAEDLETKARGAAPTSWIGSSSRLPASGGLTGPRSGSRVTGRFSGDISATLAKVLDSVSLAAARGAPFHSLFAAVDSTGRGLCTRDAFVYVLRAVLGCPLTDSELQMLIERVPNERAGSSGPESHLVDYNELYTMLVNTTPRLNSTSATGHPSVGLSAMSGMSSPWGGGHLGVGSTAGMGSVMATPLTPGLNSAPLTGLPGAGLGLNPTPLTGGFGGNMSVMGGLGNNFGMMAAPGLDALGSGASEAVIQEIARRVRALSRAQRTQWGGAWSLERVFEMYDIGRRGAIGAAEFQAALNGIGLVLSGQELAPLVRRFDKLGNGTLVDYRDFCRYVEVDSSDVAFVTAAIAQKLDEQVRQGLDVRMPFELADPSGAGFVSAREFREALRQLNLPLTELQTQALVSRYAQVGNPDLVSYDEFLKHAQAALPTASAMYHRDRGGFRDSVVDGAGYDGWRNEHSSRRGNSVWSHSRDWYERQASPKQRREFDDVYSALRTYKDEHDAERHEIMRADREMQGGFGGRSFVDDDDAELLRPRDGRSDMIGRPNRLRWDDDTGDIRSSRSPLHLRPSSRPSSRNSTPRSPRSEAGFVDQTGGGSQPTSPTAAGIAMWGKNTPLSRKGDLQPSTRSAAAERGMWVCAVCYYTENKVGASKCFICQARNPDSRDSLVVHECPNCGFQNSEFATSCEMCGTKLHGAKVPPADSAVELGGNRHVHSNRKSAERGRWTGEGDSDDEWGRR